MPTLVVVQKLGGISLTKMPTRCHFTLCLPLEITWIALVAITAIWAKFLELGNTIMASIMGVSRGGVSKVLKNNFVRAFDWPVK